jgi:SanA protein
MDFTPPRRTGLRAFMRRQWKLLTILGLLAIVPPFAADAYVNSVAQEHVYHSLDKVPPRRVALVLGTSKYAPSGNINLYYKRRLQAALDLYETGVVTRILVSGDNSQEGYDEPTFMMEDLVALGVPEGHIQRDFAGFRTLDSVIRAREVFQLDGFVAVSQEFHCLRAVYLAREAGIDAVGYCAQDVGGATGAKIRLREVVARLMAVVDIRILNKQPKFLGDPVEIG